MKKILVIDDDILVLKAISKLLSIKGFSIKEAHSGVEAIQLLQAEDFDLIISDIRMAEIDGIQVVERLRALGKDTPVILVTGYASENAPVEAYQLGVSDYILKPFDKDDLLKKVEKNLFCEKKEVIDFKKVCLELKEAIEDFEKNNDARIYADAELKNFFNKLNKLIFSIKKIQVRENA